MITYIASLMTLLSLYFLFGLSLNFTVGYAGLVSLSHASFVGIGAYVVAYCLTKTDYVFISSLLIAFLTGVTLSFCVSIPAARLRKDYFVLASLGYQVIIMAILMNWEPVTRGVYGYPGIPKPEVWGYKFKSPVEISVLYTFIAIVMARFSVIVLDSPFGRLLKAIREDEQAVESLGKYPSEAKWIAFGISAGIAALSGGLYATYMSYIDPTSFDILQSVFMLSIVIIGGTGNLRGPLAGALVVLLVPELLKWINLPNVNAANMRQIILGLIILGMMYRRPQGLLGEYRLS